MFKNTENLERQHKREIEDITRKYERKIDTDAYQANRRVDYLEKNFEMEIKALKQTQKLESDALKVELKLAKMATETEMADTYASIEDEVQNLRSANAVLEAKAQATSGDLEFQRRCFDAQLDQLKGIHDREIELMKTLIQNLPTTDKTDVNRMIETLTAKMPSIKLEGLSMNAPSPSLNILPTLSTVGNYKATN